MAEVRKMHINFDTHDAGSSSSSSTFQQAQRDEKLWFPDGNVVLVTESRLFRVHQGVLSLHSTVFNDMFAFSSEISDDDTDGMGEGGGGKGRGSDQEMHEGLPMVRLMGDSGEDVAHMLRAIYERRYYDRDNDNTSLEMVIALFLLSTKYDIAALREDVLQHISRHYPTTLAEFDAIDNDTSSLFGLPSRKEVHFPLLRAALQADADILLPGLYYACSAFSLQHIFDNEAEKMELRTLKTLLIGARKLESANRSILQLILDGATVARRGQAATVAHVCPALGGGAPCVIQRRRRPYGSSRLFNTTKLVEVQGTIVVDKCLQGMCSACRAGIAKGIDEARAVVWQRMPTMFGLPGWEELQARANDQA